MCTLPFTWTCTVVDTSQFFLIACQHYRRGAILTHSQMSRVCTLAFLQPPYLFVFSVKVHHPPLESSESHAGGAVLKVCQRGEAPGPGLQSPIATQSAWHRTSPLKSNSRTEERPGQAATRNMPSISLLLKNHRDTVSLWDVSPLLRVLLTTNVCCPVSAKSQLFRS